MKILISMERHFMGLLVVVVLTFLNDWHMAYV